MGEGSYRIKGGFGRESLAPGDRVEFGFARHLYYRHGGRT
jgi:hypothetical protein